jgi:hypothetical protein
LWVYSTAGGSVTVPGEGYFDPCYISNIAATPDGGCSFEYWECVEYGLGYPTACDIGDIYSASTTLNAVTAVLTAHFTCGASPTPTPTATTTATPTASCCLDIWAYPGYTTIEQPSCGSSEHCYICYTCGTGVPIEAYDSLHGHFSQWTGDVGTVDDVYDRSTNVTMNGNYTIYASFECSPTLTPTSTATASPSPWATPTPTATTTATPTATPPPGDVNGNWDIEAGDITALERIILGWDSETPWADANGDGTVNASDIGVVEYMILEIWPWNHVHVEAPNNMPYCTHFTATVFITYVEDFGSASFELTYNSTVLDLEGVTNGSLLEIDAGVSAEFHPVGIDYWGLVGGPGAVRINASVGGADGVDGSGYLARLQFHANGSAGQGSPIALNASQSWLRDSLGGAINATWAGDWFTVAP